MVRYVVKWGNVNIAKGQSFTNLELQSIFGVGNAGGIRKNIKNKHIILVNSLVSRTHNYRDRIEKDGKFLTYIGQGQKDQTMTGNNKSVKLSKQDGYTLFYFEKYQEGKYTFCFPVEYVSDSFDEQKNIEGKFRRVILFKLKIKK